MPYRIDIYIGSDNGSRKIDRGYLNKVRQWADGVFPDGYTVVKGQGHYRGASEDSLLLNVLSNYDIALRDQLNRLKQDLGQEAILVTKAHIDLEVF